MKLTKNNLVKVANELKLSYSILRRLTNMRPEITLGDDACFYDIETKDNKFMLGVVNDKVFYDAEEMLDYMKGFKVCCGFNNYRYDNEILFKDFPKYFKTVNFGNFVLHKIKGLINIDLLAVFMLWRPFKPSHKLNELAKELGFQRKHESGEFDENKCREDVEIMKRFYPVAKELLNWTEKNFFLDPETLCSLYTRDLSKLRRWMLQSFMLQKGIYPKLVRIEDKRKPSFFHFHRKGFFQNIYVYDVSSAYPTTAIRLNCSIWKKGDFAEYEKFLIEERKKNPAIEQYIKWLANAAIGDMNYTDGLLYNKKILCDVWLTFKKVMEDWAEKVGKENIVYSYVDCLFTKKQINVFPEGYNVRLKRIFDWLIIYNQIRYVGFSEGQIHKIHFNRKIDIKLYDYLDNMIEEKLKTNPLEFVKDPSLEALGIELKNLPKHLFKIVVKKTNNVCRSAEYLEIWDSLKEGLNDVYLSKNGITTDENKICYQKYKRYIDSYLKLFKFSSNLEKK
ncbi:MAG: hypothetical protein NZ942_01985 [Candidatus Aenigmarchaeota archaeon]|nr:hypothetical protein [Candidatus Aenigmarchaeota archaeon]